ncbi:PREDICTED: protein MLP1-like isoform X2 [Amphimedon queenslandica]|uniref:Uncharacterized protein n=1 Tax=Amphimedon queenslandica TaxID=400682 RepID=A0A1X7V3U3_AMPQE|nr:PREDICTED: protein MLP1-like isoform X2 [Amphimedon queenslandica]|eukprot:XP_011403242.1 PREDICTED: protein MLP1-like isoform X2 [Amphimedon queenslandica]
MAKQPGLAGRHDADINELRYQLEDKDSEITRLKSTLSSTNNELEHTRKQLMDKKAQYNMMEENMTDLKADVGKWKSLANRKGSTGGGGSDYDPNMINQLERTIENLQTELAHTKKRLYDTEMALQREKEENSRRERRPSGPVAMPSTDHYRVQIKHAQDENSRLTDQLLDLRDEMESLRVTNSELNYKLQEGGGRGGHYSSAAGINDEIHYLKKEIERLARENQSLSDTNMAIHQQAVIYEDDFKRERQEREEANSRFKKAQEEIQQLRRNLDEARRGRGSFGGEEYPDEPLNQSQYSQSHAPYHRTSESERTPNRGYTGYKSPQQDEHGRDYY